MEEERNDDGTYNLDGGMVKVSGSGCGWWRGTTKMEGQRDDREALGA